MVAACVVLYVYVGHGVAGFVFFFFFFLEKKLHLGHMGRTDGLTARCVFLVRILDIQTKGFFL